jgi:hypothetical protein
VTKEPKRKAGLAEFTRSEAIAPPTDDGQCTFAHEGARCPLPAKCWKTRGNEADGPKLCVGHDTLRKDVGGSIVFLKMALENRVPFVPSWADALVARRMLTQGTTRAVITAAYGPHMVPWLEADPERGTPGGKWTRDYRDAVRDAVKLEQQVGEPA